MRDVEDADLFSYRVVLFNNARIADWHIPAAKLGHLGAEFFMFLEERSLFQHWVTHGSAKIGTNCRGGNLSSKRTLRPPDRNSVRILTGREPSRFARF
jgi:hypothetical protein